MKPPVTAGRRSLAGKPRRLRRGGCHQTAIHGTVEAFREFSATVVEAVAPVAADLASAAQPLVEWRNEVAANLAASMNSTDENDAREESDP